MYRTARAAVRHQPACGQFYTDDVGASSGSGLCNKLVDFQRIRDKITMRRTDPTRRAVGLSVILRQAIELPEVNFAVFAFVLNFPWEFMQIPLYVMALDSL